MKQSEDKAGSFKKVTVLWLMTAVLFGGFNAAYWPVHRHQMDTAPENFLRYACRLQAEGRTRDAVEILRRGIDTQRPAFPEPYAVLGDWLSELGSAEAAEEHAASAVFYAALTGGAAERGGMLQHAAEMDATAHVSPALSVETTRSIRWLAGDLAAAYGVLDSVVDMPADRQLALLRLTGHALSVEGAIGTTGTFSPEDILVISGGGTEARRMAHILLRGQDFAKAERGFHAVIVEVKTGQVTQTGHFDVCAREPEAERMAGFLRRVPAGAIGAFAVYDDASVNLSAELVKELLAFGFEEQACIDRAPAILGLRYSFAGIGVKGAAQGTALQAWSPDSFGGYAGHPAACGVLSPAGTGRGGGS